MSNPESSLSAPFPPQQPGAVPVVPWIVSGHTPEALRAQAGRHAHALQPVLGWADRAQAAWQWVRARPPELLWPLALVTGLWVARRPARLISAPLRLWSVWRLWLRLSAGRRA